MVDEHSAAEGIITRESAAVSGPRRPAVQMPTGVVHAVTSDGAVACGRPLECLHEFSEHPFERMGRNAQTRRCPACEAALA